MPIDIVIVSNAVNTHVWYMTQNAINTARNNAGMKVGCVAVPEQNLYVKPYENAKTLYYDFTFNYNRCLNLGNFVCKSEYVAFCNNDLYFENKWAVNCVRAMEKNDALSASPANRIQFSGVKEGYKVGTFILGWCIVVHKKVFDHIGKFDEPVEFWYSDDVYSNQLKRAGLKHILVGNSQVRHFKSTTLRKLTGKERSEYMSKQKTKFINYVAANLKKQTETGDSH